MVEIDIRRSRRRENPETKKNLIVILVVIVLVIALAMWGLPRYKVYKLGLNGKAQLREAEFNRQIKIEEARAEKEAATLKKDAEIIRAEGIAEANRIIAGSITEEYLEYRFIEGLNDGNTEVIYVPTEANLPILEARDIR